MKNMLLFAYIAFIFALVAVQPLFSPEGAATYLSFAIFLAGMVAIVLQTRFHRGTFRDMGFRLNRNALVGMGIGLFFTMTAIFVCIGVPYLLGFSQIAFNHETAAMAGNMSPLITVPIILLVAGAMMFAACLFGEELAFRGYILPKLEERYGGGAAIALCSVIFALWHLPDYFSIYSGGAGESGWDSLCIALIGHGISVVPICILYLTTRELYGVSLYHALVNVFQYFIFGDPDFGETAKYSIYSVKTTNETASEIIGWVWHIAAIILMLGLCRMAKKKTLTTESRATVETAPHSKRCVKG
jgi:membrane protease YdiL (CAAX protease family)